MKTGRGMDEPFNRCRFSGKMHLAGTGAAVAPLHSLKEEMHGEIPPDVA